MTMGFTLLHKPAVIKEAFISNDIGFIGAGRAKVRTHGDTSKRGDI